MKKPVHSIEVPRSRRFKIKSIEQKRWAAYGTAALASSFTFSLAESAEAEIHYSGLIKQDVPNGFVFTAITTIVGTVTLGFLHCRLATKAILN
jgi:hypothetical protein